MGDGDKDLSARMGLTTIDLGSAPLYRLPPLIGDADGVVVGSGPAPARARWP